MWRALSTNSKSRQLVKRLLSADNAAERSDGQTSRTILRRERAYIAVKYRLVSIIDYLSQRLHYLGEPAPAHKSSVGYLISLTQCSAFSFSSSAPPWRPLSGQNALSSHRHPQSHRQAKKSTLLYIRSRGQKDTEESLRSFTRCPRMVPDRRPLLRQICRQVPCQSASRSTYAWSASSRSMFGV